MNVLSMDLRKRIFAARQEGCTQAQIAAHLRVSVSSVKRWLRRLRETGTLDARPSTGRKPRIDASATALLGRWLKEENDLTLAQLRQRWQEHGYPVSLSTVDAWLKRLKITRKKNDARRRTRAPGRSGPTKGVAGGYGRHRSRTPGFPG